MLTWFSSYLQDRYQNIKIDCTLSGACKLRFGVTQDSVLGPLLFSLYTTPLSYVIGKHKGIWFHFCAGDTQLYIHLTTTSATSAMDRLNSCLHDVKNWMDSNKLKLNADKIEFIVWY